MYENKKQVEELTKRISGEFAKGNFESLDQLKLCQEYGVKNNEHGLEVDCLISISLAYKSQALYLKALEVANKAERLSIKHSMEERLASSYNSQAGLHSRMVNFKKSVEAYLKALTIYKRLDNKTMIARVLANIGMEYDTYIDDDDQARKYFLEAWSVFQSLEDQSQNWLILNSLGYHYRKTGDREQSNHYFNLSFTSAKENNNIIGTCFGLKSHAEELAYNNNYEKATQLIREALSLSEKIPAIQPTLHLTLAKFSLANGDATSAEATLLKSLPTLKRKRLKFEAYKLLMEAYEQQEKFKQAYEVHKEIIALKEELYNEESKNDVQSTEAKYQSQIKEQEKELLRLQSIEMEQKGLRAQLNPQFFIESLDNLKQLILTGGPNESTKYLRSFSGFLRKTLEHSEEGSVSLEDEIAYLQDFLNLQKEKLKDKLNYSITIEDDDELDFFRVPSMLLQKLAEISLKRAIKHEDQSDLSIHIDFVEDAVHINVTSNPISKCFEEEDNRVIRELRQHKNFWLDSLGLQVEIEETCSLEERTINFAINVLNEEG